MIYVVYGYYGFSYDKILNFLRKAESQERPCKKFDGKLIIHHLEHLNTILTVLM